MLNFTKTGAAFREGFMNAKRNFHTTWCNVRPSAPYPFLSLRWFAWWSGYNRYVSFVVKRPCWVIVNPVTLCA